MGADKTGSRYVFFVRDNGIGFEQKSASELFTAFNRLENGIKFDGNGIVLSFVKRIIEAHGGQVWAKGKENEGATFYFSLPFHREILTTPALAVPSHSLS